MATREANRLELRAEQPTHGVGTWVPVPLRLGSSSSGSGSTNAPIAAPPLQNPIVQRRGRMDAVWEAHKATIKSLYLDEGRSLKEVIEIMKTNHGLEASPKLFKSRLKRWGFSKYITNKLEREALQHVVSSGLVSNSLQREGAAAPETVQLSNGTMISLSSLFAHLDRKRPAASPHPMSVLRPLRSPGGLWISEEMLVNAREYVLREYTTRGCAQHDVRAILPLHFGDLSRGFVSLRRLLQEARVEDALLVLRRAPDQIRSSLFGPAASNALGCICMTVLCVKYNDSREQDMIATLRSLLKYAASLVQEGSGPEALRQILLRLVEVDDALFRESMIQAWKCELQTWTAMMEPGWNIPLLSEWLALAETAGFDQLPPNLGSGLEETIRTHEAQYGRESLPVMTLLWFQAEYERLLASHHGTSMEKTRGLFQALIGRGPEHDMLIQYAAQYFLAQEYQRSGDRVNAERFLRDAIDSLCNVENRPCYGWSSELEMMFDLERWFIEWGEPEKALDTRQKRLEMCLAHKRRSSRPTNQSNNYT